MISLPGVFAYGRLDEGTRLLLATLSDPMPARVLDVGCGTGVIGAVIQKGRPQTRVDMVDVDALALEATRRTLLANGLPVSDERIRPSNIFSAVEGRYDLIVSNPPFHAGVKTDDQMVAAFFAQAAQHLNPGGTLRIVANRFLKYRPLIERQLGACRVVRENRSYCVYEGGKD